MKKRFVLVLIVAISAFMLLRESRIDTLNPGIGKSIIDNHVHIAGLGYGDSGCFINARMRNNYRFPFYLWSLDVTEDELKKYGDQILLQKVSAKIADSKTVKQAVILAMDGYVDDQGSNQGKLNRQETQIFVPNDYVAKETARYTNLLFGASINPNRKDALRRLQQVKDQGAVLIKWIPSIMNINPSNPDGCSSFKTTKLITRNYLPL